MNVYYQAPQLDKFFSSFKKGTAYCFICLRTKHETKLVNNNEAVKTFAKEIKMDIKFKHNNICYICEYKALKALQFFKSLTFAVAVDTIFADIILHKNNHYNVFRKNNFKKLMDKFGFPATMMLPSTWEAEFAAVRSSTTLTQTKTLTLGVDGKPLHTRNTGPPRDIYLIPDEPPGADTIGGVTEILKNNPDCDALNMKDNFAKQFRGILRAPATEKTVENVAENPLFSTNVDNIQTLVILDDEDSNEQCIKISKVESQAPTVPETPPNSQPTRLVPIQNLLEKPTPKLTVPLENLLIQPRDVFTGNSLLLTTPNGPTELHPIAIREGVTVVPSINAKIVNGVLIYNDPAMNLAQEAINVSSAANTQKDNEKNALLKSYLSKGKTIDIYGPKRDSVSDIDEVATPVKKSKVLPENVEDRSRIDWEDKIPMDVISFVDAVDPNPIHNIQAPMNMGPIGPPVVPIQPPVGPVSPPIVAIGSPVGPIGPPIGFPVGTETSPVIEDTIDPQPSVSTDDPLVMVSIGTCTEPSKSCYKNLQQLQESQETDPLAIEDPINTEPNRPVAWGAKRRGRPPMTLPKIEEANYIIDLS
ncbi:uncharacterized protein LOC110381805 [Helicoverpa armigera]|uniref:uncharacterized protein LOC110381805 n=1 Tax=Helicoverpa armigera TaxID=29058 RepID=UPI003082C91C